MSDGAPLLWMDHRHPDMEDSNAPQLRVALSGGGGALAFCLHHRKATQYQFLALPGICPPELPVKFLLGAWLNPRQYRRRIASSQHAHVVQSDRCRKKEASVMCQKEKEMSEAEGSLAPVMGFKANAHDTATLE